MKKYENVQLGIQKVLEDTPQEISYELVEY